MKRFRFDGVDLVENATGRWVLYADHAVRVAELEDIEAEALRIQTKASLAGDQYAYDLMRTVLGKQPQEGE